MQTGGFVTAGPIVHVSKSSDGRAGVVGDFLGLAVPSHLDISSGRLRDSKTDITPSKAAKTTILHVQLSVFLIQMM